MFGFALLLIMFVAFLFVACDMGGGFAKCVLTFCICVFLFGGAWELLSELMAPPTKNQDTQDVCCPCHPTY